METLLTLGGAVAPVFLLIGAGLLVRRADWIPAGSDRGLFSLTINVFFPCFILRAIVGNPALDHAGNLVLAPLLGFLTVAAGLGLARLVAPLVVVDPGRRGSFALSTGLYNYSYISLPMAQLLFDRETVGVLFVFNTGVELCLWTLGLWVLTGEPPHRSWRRCLNAPFFSVIGALALNAAGAAPHIPVFAGRTIDLLAACAVPIALLLTGVTMADFLPEFHPSRAGCDVAAGVVLRLGILPLVFLGLAWAVPTSIELSRVLVLQAAMPSAVVPIILSRYHGGHPGVAIRIVLATSALGLVTIPLWVHFGMKILNLAAR